jgi:hypothetical protein
MLGTPLPLVSVVVVVLAFVAPTSVSIAGAVPQPGGSTDTTITIAGLNCDTNYRVSINPVGVSGKPATLLIRTQPCASPPLPSSGVITIAGLNCDTNYRISINPVGASGKPATLLIRTQPCDSPPPPEPPPPEPPPSQEPGPIAGQGYTRVFADEFDLLNRGVWCNRQWWEGPTPAGSQTIVNGELRLRRARAVGNYANTTMSTEPCGQANPKSFRYGYLEARMRHETTRGNGPAFWLLPTRFQEYANSPAWNPNVPPPFCQQNGLPVQECYASELDVFEGFGNINYGGSRTDDWFSGALHRNTNGWFGVPDQVRGVSLGTGAEMEEYHTYSARWTPTEVCWFFDGAQVGCRAAFDSTNQPMYLLLYNWNTVWETENMPNSTTEPELDVFVDWVRVWQR